MSNELTIVIIGLYTLVYVIVFFVQKSQINQTKEINTSMKSFMDVFKIDEVKKYIEMRNERIMHDATKMITDSDQIKKISNDLIKNTTAPIEELYHKIMGERYGELLEVVFEIILTQKPEKQEQFIEDLLPNNKHYLLQMLKDYKNNHS